MSDERHHPPESNLKRLELRDPDTQGRRAWGHGGKRGRGHLTESWVSKANQGNSISAS